MLAISLLSFQQSGFTKILQGSAHGRLRQFQFSGDGRNRRPAFTVFVGSIRKVDIDGFCTVRELHAIQKIKSAYRDLPPAAWVPPPFRYLFASARPVCCLSCSPFPAVQVEA